MSRKVVAVVAAAGGIMLLVVAFVAISVRAQQECPSPQLIDTITGSGDQDSAPFTITTGSFRISYETTADDSQAPFIVDVVSADPSQSVGPTGSISRNGSASGETFASVPPGRYFLKILTTGGTQYTVKIEECGQGGEANPNEGTSTQGTVQPRTTPKSTSPPSQPASPFPPTTPPKAPSPAQPQGPVFKAGGPSDGPVPLMPGGGCPREFPDMRGNACFG